MAVNPKEKGPGSKEGLGINKINDIKALQRIIQGLEAKYGVSLDDLPKNIKEPILKKINELKSGNEKGKGGIGVWNFENKEKRGKGSETTKGKNNNQDKNMPKTNQEVKVDKKETEEEKEKAEILEFLEEIGKISKWEQVEEIKQRLIDRYCGGDREKFIKIPEEIRYTLSQVSEQELQKGRGKNNKDETNMPRRKEKISGFDELDKDKKKETVKEIEEEYEILNPEDFEEEGKDKGKKVEKEEDKKPGVEKELEDIETKKLKSRQESIYNKYYDAERFGLDAELVKEIQGELEIQMKNVLVAGGRKWLEEQIDINPDDFPSLNKEIISQLDENQVMEWVRDKKEFDKFLRENEDFRDWKIINNLMSSVEFYGEKTPPEVKAVIFKRLSEGSTKEKLWERTIGKTLSEVITSDIGKREDVIESKKRDYRNEKMGDIFRSEWEGLSPEQKRLAGSLEDYSDSRIDGLRDKLNERLKGKKEFSKDDVFALLYSGVDPESIEEAKLGIIYFWEKEKNKISLNTKGKESKFTLKQLEKLIGENNKVINEDLKEIEKETGEKWDELYNNKKNEIIKLETEKITSDMVESCYKKIAQDVAAQELAKKLDKDPKRQKRIEEEFGKGKKGTEKAKEQIFDLIAAQERAEEGEGFEYLEEQGILEQWGINPLKITDKEKARLEKLSEKKYGLIDWILEVLFGKEK